MLLNSYILAYARCLAGKVCGLVRSTWGTSQGEDRDKILNTKVACRACAGHALGKHSPNRAHLRWQTDNQDLDAVIVSKLLVWAAVHTFVFFAFTTFPFLLVLFFGKRVASSEA